MMGLDKKDRRILHQLDLDARQSDSQIAREVGLSRDAVRYRIDKLIDDNYINYFMTILNSMKLGYDWYRTFFRFHSLNPSKEEEIIDWLRQRASWLSKVQGKWDLNTGTFAQTVYGFRDILKTFLVQYSEYIASHEVAIVTREWTYHRNYLLTDEKNTTQPDLMGFDKDEKRETVELDDTDYAIVKVLLKNARKKTVDIARELDLTEAVVRYRLKNLEEKGVILSYRPFLNAEKLGYTYFKLHLFLRDLTREKLKNIYQYIHDHPKTLHTTELVGGADIETEFQVTNNKEFYEYVDDLRSNFSDTIQDYEFMEYTKEYKFTYLPEQLL